MCVIWEIFENQKKTLWEKEKMVTNIFSFSHNIFQSYFPLIR